MKVFRGSLFATVATLAVLPLVVANPVSKASVAVHGSTTADPLIRSQYQIHSLNERAPVSSISPNVTNPAWIKGILARVALWREAHQAAPLVWSTTLAQYALDSANKCQLAHTGGPYGENIYWISSSSIDFYAQMKQGVDAWGNEYTLYDPNNPYKSEALHFTALVWKNARHIGCSWSSTTCPGPLGGFLLYCEMDPVTNVIGQFTQNVTP